MSFREIGGKIINMRYVISVHIEDDHIYVYFTHRLPGYVCVNCDSYDPCTCVNSLFLHKINSSYSNYDGWKRFIGEMY
jgi:hypothetical protein